jgi:hypothetical protein
MNKDQIESMVKYFGLFQNDTLKLNAGQIREAINLVLRALCWEIILKENEKTLTQELEMKNGKKAAVKKAKPAAKPLPKKK